MILLVREDRAYLREPGDRLETDLGVLDVPADAQPGDRLETHLGTEFRVRELRGPDCFEHFERTGAPMLPRDIGLVMGHTGVAAGDRVLDAGTGTGVLAAYLGRAGASVVTYEVDPEFAAVARQNMALTGVTPEDTGGEDDGDESDASTENDGDEGTDAARSCGGTVEVRTGDVTEDLDALVAGKSGESGASGGTADAEPFDLVTLDTADAPAVTERAPELLAEGGFLAAYVPFVEGSRAVVEAARSAGLEDVETYETIQRRMDFDDRGSRPTTAGVGHTGYLTITRNG